MNRIHILKIHRARYLLSDEQSDVVANLFSAVMHTSQWGNHPRANPLAKTGPCTAPRVNSRCIFAFDPSNDQHVRATLRTGEGSGVIFAIGGYLGARASGVEAKADAGKKLMGCAETLAEKGWL